MIQKKTDPIEVAAATVGEGLRDRLAGVHGVTTNSRWGVPSDLSGFVMHRQTPPGSVKRRRMCDSDAVLQWC